MDQNRQRIWRLTKQADGSWKSTAGDVILGAGDRESGWQYFALELLLELPVEDKTYKVNFDDWMYLVDKNVMLNR